ncbi:carboxylate-amine ligase [Streptomyces echinatus]|uniref:carboxylate-amine ligase n=1 Tax=Streptomyces echinatus TaxID=67293 RepID=UPI0031F026FE
MTPAAAGAPMFPAEVTAPPTVGVEEEFILAERHSRAAVYRAPSVVRAALGHLGASHVTAEVSQAQVETVSAVCRTAAELEAEIGRLRRGAATAAAEHDCLLVPSGTAVLGRPGPPPLADKPRYRAFARSFGPLIQDQGVNACHVHVGVADRDEAVRAVNHLRGLDAPVARPHRQLPLQRRDGHRLRELAHHALEPVALGGSPAPPAGRGALRPDRRPAHRHRSGDGPGMIYWHVRPSPHLPTIEVRVADVLPDAAATTAYALLVRALVGGAVEAVRAGEPAPEVPDPLLRAACWQAARHGTACTLPATHTRDHTPTAVGRLVEELWKRVEPQLSSYGDDRWVSDWLGAVQHGGSGSSLQRRVAEHHGGSLQAVVDALAVEPG